MPQGPIGVFDSGYGGLTVLKEIRSLLPSYDYLYLGDNARAPYGPRSFETIYEYTLEAVKYLFEQNCSLVLLACNTASAKALRTIQQKDLPKLDPSKRVLGVIRPTTEVIGNHSQSKEVGILGTPGTIKSNSYKMEIERFFPKLTVYQQACPMWVPLVENHEVDGQGTDYFVNKYLNELFGSSENIDTILLACTHYPLLLNKIENWVSDKVQVLTQGEIVANSLKNYLNRHPEMEERCAKNHLLDFRTTDDPEVFGDMAKAFFGLKVNCSHIHL